MYEFSSNQDLSGHQPQKLERQPIILQLFYQKLHENKENLARDI